MKHDIISEKQFGFVKNRGTTDALNYISKIIYKNIGSNTLTIVSFLDLTKAFDIANHKILLDKFERYGCRCIALKLMTSYLTDRRQKVKIDDVKSKYKEITTGVPQGTILGPLLFILYVNDLLSHMPNEVIMSYADDNVIISSDDTWSSAQDKMCIYLNYVAI